MKLVAALAVLALLAGCGSEKSTPNPILSAIGGMAKDTVTKSKSKKGKAKGNGAGKAEAVAARRAELEKAGKPVLRVSSATLGQAGLTSVIDSKGDVVTWKTPDGATFSLRNGVLIQTRGLGADLMSAQAPSVGQLLRGADGFKRVYYFLGPDDQGTRRTYDCASAVVGQETIEIMGRSHAVTHVTETCQRSLGKVTNDYWIEGSTIRKSRQWVSAGIGHVEFERVVD